MASDFEMPYDNPMVSPMSPNTCYLCLQSIHKAAKQWHGTLTSDGHAMPLLPVHKTGFWKAA
jgi:hypothetical protein